MRIKYKSEACLKKEGTLNSVTNIEVSCEGAEQSQTTDPAAICRSSDPMAVRELLTKIGGLGLLLRDDSLFAEYANSVLSRRP